MPAIVVAGISVTLPRKLVYIEEGYLGPPSIFAILEGIVRPSLLHSATGQLGLAALVPLDLLVRVVTYFVAPAVLVAVVVLSIAMVYGWARGRSFDTLPRDGSRATPLGHYHAGGARDDRGEPLRLRPAVSGDAHGALLDSPVRTGLSRPREEVAGRIAGATDRRGVRDRRVCLFCIVQFATQFNTRYYAEWAYCAATKDMMQIIRTQHAAKPDARVRVGASWEFEPGINFYRAMWQLAWMEPVFRESPDADYDYYLLLHDDISLIERRRLKLLLKDDLFQVRTGQGWG